VLEHNLRTIVLDGDALHLFEPDWLVRNGAVVLTPHYGEYRAIMDRLGIKSDPALDVFAQRVADVRAMAPSGFPPVAVLKGATTYIVAQDAIRVSPRGSAWLSTAGTGDVLAGAIAAMAAAYWHRGGSMFDAAAAGVWLHAQAAHGLGAGFIADDLAAALGAARAAL
jgi:NAD(P)H-hydrate repair Nnr-like enzyme with NAD(P)H-hydrate dehydratase domain